MGHYQASKLRLTARLLLTGLCLSAPATAFADEQKTPAAGTGAVVKGEADAADALRKAAMRRLAFLEGDWEGINIARLPDGSEQRSRSVDRIAFRMDGEILTIAGQGFAPGALPGALPVMENFGIFDYDTATGAYRVTSYALGLRMDGPARFREDGKLQWEIEAGPRKVRFLAWPQATDDGTAGWIETGEFSFDGGKSWTPAFVITFRRQGRGG